MVVRFLFKATGWVLSEDPDKDVGFRQVLSALGVEFDLSAVHRGVLRIGDTAKRKTDLHAMVGRHLSKDSISPEDSESLRSWLMFAESQIFGRSAKLALKAVGAPALKGVACSLLTDDVKFGHEWMLKRLVETPPREIRAKESETFLLFIDGACEQATGDDGTLVTSIGAVLLGSSGGGLNFLGLQVPGVVTDAWAEGGKRNLVFEAEVLPYTLALTCWG